MDLEDRLERAENVEKIRNLTPLQRFDRRKKIGSHRILNETKKIAVARDHLTKEEIKEYSILYLSLIHI